MNSPAHTRRLGGMLAQLLLVEVATPPTIFPSHQPLSDPWLVSISSFQPTHFFHQPFFPNQRFFIIQDGSEKRTVHRSLDALFKV